MRLQVALLPLNLEQHGRPVWAAAVQTQASSSAASDPWLNVSREAVSLMPMAPRLLEGCVLPPSLGHQVTEENLYLWHCSPPRLPSVMASLFLL